MRSILPTCSASSSGGHFLVGDVFRADLLGDVGLEIGLGRAGVNEDAKAFDQQLHRAQQPDGAGAEDHGIEPVAAALAVAIVMFPDEALLHLPGLRQALLGDGQRFGHHGHVAQFLRHGREVDAPPRRSTRS